MHASEPGVPQPRAPAIPRSCKGRRRRRYRAQALPKVGGASDGRFRCAFGLSRHRRRQPGSATDPAGVDACVATLTPTERRRSARWSRFTAFAIRRLVPAETDVAGGRLRWGRNGRPVRSTTGYIDSRSAGAFVARLPLVGSGALSRRASRHRFRRSEWTPPAMALGTYRARQGAWRAGPCHPAGGSNRFRVWPDSASRSRPQYRRSEASRRTRLPRSRR